MDNYMFKKLNPHFGHHIVCVRYGDPDDPVDVCIECEDCGEVLISAEDFELGEDFIEGIKADAIADCAGILAKSCWENK